jgi:hypothetical protein
MALPAGAESPIVSNSEAASKLARSGFSCRDSRRSSGLVAGLCRDRSRVWQRRPNTRQREKLVELRNGAEHVSKHKESDVASLIDKCWVRRPRGYRFHRIRRG